MNRRMLLLGLVALLPAMACAQGGPTAAQPELPKEKLVVVTRDGVKHDFNVEMALTPQQQETGLMFRPTVPADGGMLFDWGSSREMAMWMHNTVAPLDMLFINTDGTIRRIRREHDAAEPGDDSVQWAGAGARWNLRLAQRRGCICGSAIRCGSAFSAMPARRGRNGA